MNNKNIPILFLVIAAVLWSSAGLLIKMISWNPIAISGIRSGIAAIVMLLYWNYKTNTLLPKMTKFKLVAALNYVCLVTFFVVANKLTTSANAILLQFTAPAWVLLFSIFLLKEKVSRKDISVVLLVFSGMIIFFVGDINVGNMLGNLFGVLSGASMALMIISMKRIKDGSPLEIVIWGNIFTFFISLPFFRNLDVTMGSISGIILLGVFQLGVAYIFFTKGIEKVTALEGILIPVLEPLLNPIWVLLGTGETPSQYALVGGVVVISAVLFKSISDYYDRETKIIEVENPA